MLDHIAYLPEYLKYLRSFLFRNGVNNGFKPKGFEAWVEWISEEEEQDVRDLNAHQRSMSRSWRYV